MPRKSDTAFPIDTFLQTFVPRDNQFQIPRQILGFHGRGHQTFRWHPSSRVKKNFPKTIPVSSVT